MGKFVTGGREYDEMPIPCPTKIALERLGRWAQPTWPGDTQDFSSFYFSENNKNKQTKMNFVNANVVTSEKAWQSSAFCRST